MDRVVGYLALAGRASRNSGELCVKFWPCAFPFSRWPLHFTAAKRRDCVGL